jgi:hypothetical protein
MPTWASYEQQDFERLYSKRDVYERLCDGMDPVSDESLSSTGGFVTIRKIQGFCFCDWGSKGLPTTKLHRKD